MFKAAVVIDEEWNIGKSGGLLTHLPKDLKRYKDITEFNFIVMGRKTLESLPGGKPLKNRVNIVLTRDRNFFQDGVITFHSKKELMNFFEALKPLTISADVIISGGREIYDLLLEETDEIAITKIHHTFEGADTQFPNLDEEPNWEFEDLGQIEDGDYKTSLLLYSRIK